MKKITITCLLLIFIVTFKGHAQNKPEKVTRFIKEMHDKSWYETQAILWEQEVKKDPKNEESWLNLYTAYRSICVLDKFSDVSGKKVTEVVDRMEKEIPETFTFNLTKGWLMGCWDPASMKYIEKAYQIDPENPDTYNELALRYELAQNHEKRKEFHVKMFQKNDFSPGVLNYNYNVLASLEKDAILFTEGDNDTFPVWILQDALGFRTDVTVININLAGINEYRDKLFKKAGIVTDPAKAKALFLKEDFTPETRKAWNKLLIKTIAENSEGKPFYIGLTMGNSESFRPINDKLYITGLALRYSNDKLDNISYIRKNYEKKFLLDYVKTTFTTDISQNVVNKCNQNYIAPFILLYKNYQTTEEKEKAEELKQLLLKIGRENNREKEVSDQLK